MKDLSEGAKAAGEAVSKASAAAQDHALKLSEKCKAYYKSEKGQTEYNHRRYCGGSRYRLYCWIQYLSECKEDTD